MNYCRESAIIVVAAEISETCGLEISALFMQRRSIYE